MTQRKKKKLLILNCNLLKTGRRKKFKFGDNEFSAFLNILVNSEKPEQNAPLKSFV